MDLTGISSKFSYSYPGHKRWRSLPVFDGGGVMSVGSGTRLSLSGSGQSNSSGELLTDEPAIAESNGHHHHHHHNNNHHQPMSRSQRARNDSWWSVGEYLDGTRSVALTHQSAKFTLTGNRVFGNQKEEVWDLTDSLAELYQRSQQVNEDSTLQLTRTRAEKVDVQEWLAKDTNNGFIRIYPPDVSSFSYSQLIPCSLSTSVHRICIMLGISLNSLHIQLNGDIIRRMDPYEHPLVIQNEYLSGLGFNDIQRMQEEGVSEDLGFLCRFYAGKPMFDSTYSRNQLQAFIEIRKGKMMHQWTRRLCVVSGTRLLIYKDKTKQAAPAVVQLAKGAVEEVKFKGHELCLKLTSTLQGERSIFLSFSDLQEYNKWFRKCKKATDKLPTSADLSNCHLEFLPENIFINDQLAMLHLRHNVLRERPIEEDIYTIGWLDDLPRFSRLRSLNLADNNLVSFPMALCSIRTLVELNIASNKLEEIPSDIAMLSNLQALHVHNNHLHSLPEDMIALRKLFILVLAFNQFTTVPPVVAQMTDVRTSEVDKIIMAGNQIEVIPSETLTLMKYAKKLDFRLNRLTLPPTDTTKFTALEHVTHLDIRDNFVKDLDVRSIKTLEYLNCERNEMSSLQLNGMALKNLFAAHNCLEKLVITPKPEWLLQMDVSHNELKKLPEWLSDCFFLQKLNASHNDLTELPSRLFLEAKKLKSLRVNHNQMSQLPQEVDTLFLEELHVQHNHLTRLPPDLLKCTNKLRVLNATKNRLTSLPPLNPNEDLNKVQELYLTANMLGDSCLEIISGFPRLKVLHLAHNEIYNIYDNDIRKLELLQELNVAGNQLRSVPQALGALSKLVVLRAHSNILQNLPDFKTAKALRVLDVGHNQLLDVSVTSLMASQINLLDMSLNAQLKVDPQEFKTVKNRKSICLVDLTGQGRQLPGLHSRRASKKLEQDELDHTLPWKVGFSETSGMRNKLCVATLRVLKFRNENEALFAMFDGGHNNEVPKILLERIPQIMKEELAKEKTSDQYMKYTMLSAHKKLRMTGQRLGASGAICHLCRMTNNQVNQYVLQLANVGDVEMVLCRKGEAVVLTRSFQTSEDREECQRVYSADGIVTEDNKVNGTTKNTRLLGCAYLYPSIIPDPYTTTVALHHDDEFVILATHSMWRYVSYEEAVEEVYEIGNPVVAAKKLQDLAQGYGSRENIGVLIIRLNTDKGPSLGRLKTNKSMSIDDMEAAVQHEARRARKMGNMPPEFTASTGKILDQNVKSPAERAREAEKENAKTQPNLDKRSLVMVNTSSNQTSASSSASSRQEQRRSSSSRLSRSEENRRSVENAAITSNDKENVAVQETTKSNSKDGTAVKSNSIESTAVKSNNKNLVQRPPLPPSSPQSPTDSKNSATFVSSNIVIDGSPRVQRRAGRSPASRSPASKSPVVVRSRAMSLSPFRSSSPLQDQETDLRPLPNQRYRKKNIAQEWESILQKRLTGEVKDMELKQLGSSISQESLFTPTNNGLAAVDINIDQSLDGSTRKLKSSQEELEKNGTWRNRKITKPWVDDERNKTRANPAYSIHKEPQEKDIINMTAKAKRPRRVMAAVALFENLQRESQESTSPPRKPTKVMTIERDERTTLVTGPRAGQPASPQNQKPITSPQQFPRKTVIIESTSNPTSPTATSPKTMGSIESELYSKVRKVVHKDINDNTSQSPVDDQMDTADVDEDDDDVRVVEIARL